MEWAGVPHLGYMGRHLSNFSLLDADNLKAKETKNAVHKKHQDVLVDGVSITIHIAKACQSFQ